MADFDANLHDLDMLVHNLDALERRLPNEMKKVLRKVGNAARKLVLAKAKMLVGKKTGNYYKSIKRGKVYYNRQGDLQVRIYSNKRAPHAHLIEDGHRIVGKDGSEHGYQPGYHVFDKAGPEVESQFYNILVTEFDKILRDL